MSKTKTKDRLTPRAGSSGHERRSSAGGNQQKRMLSQEDGSVPTESMHDERAPD